MDRDTSTSRRRFTKVLASASLVGATFLAGCGEESAYGGGGDGGGGDTTTTTTTEGGDGGGGNTTTTTTTEGGDGGNGSQPSFGGFLDNTSNYDGVTDQTGTDSTTVQVGVEANDGNFGFGPAAIRISKGTTVKWEWTGKGSQHNVVHTDGAFESDLHEESGVHFEHDFSSTGTFKYVCQPHESLGMKGVVVVE